MHNCLIYSDKLEQFMSIIAGHPKFCDSFYLYLVLYVSQPTYIYSLIKSLMFKPGNQP